MFVDFNKVFNNKPQTELKIPSAMVGHLNSKLPKGIRYQADEKGGCQIVSDDGHITIGGLVFKPTQEHKNILGKNYTHDDVLRYSYNAQKAIPLELRKEGIILLNGEEFPIDRLYYKPHNPISFVSGSMLMNPMPFPGEFSLPVGCDKYSLDLIFKRVPNESVYVSAYESEPQKPLLVKYYLDELKGTLSFSISFNLNYATSVRDIVESTSIYNAFANGEGLFCGQPLVAEFDSSAIKKYDAESIVFWEKVLQIEQIIGVSFVPPTNDVDYNTMYIVEALYQNLINKKPIRVNKKIDSIEGKWNMRSNNAVNSSIGKPVFFEFESISHASIFGTELDLPCLIGIFNSRLSNYSLKDKKYKLSLDHENEENKMYVSELRFLSEHELRSYKDSNPNDRISLFHDAKTVQFYLEN